MQRATKANYLLINTVDDAFASAVEAALAKSVVRPIRCRPGISFMEMARRQRPEIAVLDHVEERMDAAQMEIAVLKELRQDVRIIIVSRKPSAQDARVVESGVFFYMAEPAMPELVRVIEAAARPSSTPAATVRN